MILPGDGVGQEVTASAIEVLDFIIEEYSLDFSMKSMSIGGQAYEEFGTPIPEEVISEAKNSDAKVLFFCCHDHTRNLSHWPDTFSNIFFFPSIISNAHFECRATGRGITLYGRYCGPSTGGNYY